MPRVRSVHNDVIKHTTVTSSLSALQLIVVVHHYRQRTHLNPHDCCLSCWQLIWRVAPSIPIAAVPVTNMQPMRPWVKPHSWYAVSVVAAVVAGGSQMKNAAPACNRFYFWNNLEADCVVSRHGHNRVLASLPQWLRATRVVDEVRGTIDQLQWIASTVLVVPMIAAGGACRPSDRDDGHAPKTSICQPVAALLQELRIREDRSRSSCTHNSFIDVSHHQLVCIWRQNEELHFHTATHHGDDNDTVCSDTKHVAHSFSKLLLEFLRVGVVILDRYRQSNGCHGRICTGWLTAADSVCFV